MEIKAFTKHNPKLGRLFLSEDSFRYRTRDEDVIIAIADGITRDPKGMANFPKNLDEKAKRAIAKRYPRPSPAKIAADLFCDSVIKNLNKPSISSVKQAMARANEDIKHLNAKNNPSPDYLENDFWACVGACGIIAKNILYYGYICDCGVCIFDKTGKLRFITKDEGPNVLNKQIWSNHLLKRRSWSEAEARKILRSHFRNNPKEKYSYGAFTGESDAMQFIKTGKMRIEKAETVVFFTDGMRPLLESCSSDFIGYFNKLESYVEKNSGKIDGSEGTLVAFKLEN